MTPAKAGVFLGRVRALSMKVQQPVIGKLNQGSIFSCATADRYPDAAVHGLVITARCDMAQGKSPVMNYVPVVSFDDWMKIDGFEIARDRVEKRIRGEVVSLLKEWSIAPSVLLATDLPEVVRTYLDGLDEKARRRATERGERVLQRYALLRNCNTGDVRTLADLDERIVHDIVKELMHYKLSGHYYIAGVLPEEPPACYVALLRESSFLPRDLAGAIAKGIAIESVEYRKNPSWSRWLRVKEDDMAMPIGVLPSPHVEHLMQTFSMLFGRIGLPDTQPDHVDEYCRRAGAING